MQKKIILYIIGGFIALGTCSFFTSCSQNKPEHLLSPKDMAAILSEIRIAEAQLYNENTKLANQDSIRIKSQMVYASLFKKFETTYQDYQLSLKYYMDSPKKMEKILQISAAQLKELESKAKASK
ncbi:MAG: DUF4296 domain-containing protein [Bacteroidales bacterium]